METDTIKKSLKKRKNGYFFQGLESNKCKRKEKKKKIENKINVKRHNCVIDSTFYHYNVILFFNYTSILYGSWFFNFFLFFFLLFVIFCFLMLFLMAYTKKSCKNIKLIYTAINICLVFVMCAILKIVFFNFVACSNEELVNYTPNSSL